MSEREDWDGSAFVGLIVALMVVLGVVLYEISKTVTDLANTEPQAD